MVFTTEGFFEVAIESWPEWDLNPRPLLQKRPRHRCFLMKFVKFLRTAF